MKFLILGLSLALSGMAQAEVYKWTDANGKVHFGDQPPPKVVSKQVKVHQSQGLSGPVGSGAPKDANTPDPVKAAADPNRLAQCAVLKQRLQDIQQNKRLKLIAADGSSKRLSSNERQDHLHKIEEDIARVCAGL